MLQTSDTAISDTPSRRANWIALLARSPLDFLESNFALAARFDAYMLRHPETGLMMVQGRAGGSGARFNLGEVTVTRCAVRLTASDATQAVGVSYVLGRSRRKAHLAALCDALWQADIYRQSVEQYVLAPLRGAQEERRARARAQTAATRVDFFTMVRGEDDR